MSLPVRFTVITGPLRLGEVTGAARLRGAGLLLRRQHPALPAAAAGRDGELATERWTASPAWSTCAPARTCRSSLPALRRWRKRGIEPELIFLEYSDPVLVNRFKETRRKHPLLLQEGGILPSLERERTMLADLKARADKVIDTSDYTPRSLALLLGDLFSGGSQVGLTISVLSFGFKHGLPLDADLVFDVRFLANPHYVRELRWQTGATRRSGSTSCRTRSRNRCWRGCSSWWSSPFPTTSPRGRHT